MSPVDTTEASRLRIERSALICEANRAAMPPMRYAIAIWNYCWEPAGLEDWIADFAAHGYDTISLGGGQFAHLAPADVARVADTLRDGGLFATVHGTCDMDPASMRMMVEGLGDRLLCFTMDSSKQEDSRGTLHNPLRIAAALAHLQKLTEGTGTLIGVEDFPLDTMALAHFAPELGSVYEHPRTGMLVDIGHMHLRMKRSPYFSGLTVREYFERLPCRLVEVHVHDNNGERDEHGHLGMGTVPFGETAATLRDTGFDGVCTIEIAPGFHGSTPAESRPHAFESLRRWRELMESTGCRGETALPE